ncbi:MAG: hypothetical protein IJL60_07790 [Clostridiales bacterium]|nr:hypothetical protein [Clostridiales bacterium]
MAEIKENQNRIFPTGKLVYALSWLALIGFLLKIGRLIIFFANAKGISTVLSIFLFVLNVASACVLFVLARRSSIFRFAGIALLLASTSDLLVFSEGMTNSFVFFVFLPIYLIMLLAFLIFLSKGMQECVESSGGDAYYMWPKFRKAAIFLYAAFLLLLSFFFSLSNPNDELLYGSCAIMLFFACHVLLYILVILLNKTAKELNEPTKSS